MFRKKDPQFSMFYALAVTPEEAYIAPGTLYYFRDRVVGDKAVQKVFDTTTEKIIKTLSLRQRSF